jgi:ABC transporter fused permease/ATP-binding protein
MADQNSRSRRSLNESDEVPAKGSMKDIRRLARLVALVRPHKIRFAIATFALLGGSGLGLLYPQALRYGVDKGLALGSIEELNWITLGVVVILVTQAALTWVRHYLMSWLGERAVADLRRLVFERILKLPTSWFEGRRSGELVGRLASDVTVVEGIVGSELSIALRNAVTLTGGVALLFYENVKLTVMMLAVVPPIMVAVVAFGRLIRKMSRILQDKLAVASAQVAEAIGAIQTVQAFGREKHEAKIYTHEVEGAFFEALRLARWRASFFSTMGLGGMGGVALIIWMGGRAVIAGELSGGDLAAFLLYTLMVATSVGSISGLWGNIQRAVGATDRLFDMIDTVPDIRDPEKPEAVSKPRGDVVFESVDFSYPQRQTDQVLFDVNLHLPPGETLAVVGPSGAGKSTLSKLLFRFYDVSGGSVKVDGHDVRSLKLEDLRNLLAVVAQEPVLFSGTVAENIAYGDTRASQDAIEEAAQKAYAHDFITEFPEGYQTQVGERGITLSGGQKQRIAIARAILADPRVLILDEATSSLDAQSEHLVQKALLAFMQGRTTLVIAHRLSTVQAADRIVVLDGGRVVEKGSHEKLMADEGLYRRLVQHQLIAEGPSEAA